MITYIVTCFVVLLTIWYVLYFKYERYLTKFKGPRSIPMLGCALDFRSTLDILPVFFKYQQKYGGIVKCYFGFGPPMLLITDYKFLEYVLNSPNILNKSEDYDFLHRWLGTGLLTSAAVKWRKHRKILTPSFHFQILEQFIDTFNNYSNILVEKLNREVGKCSFDIYPYITLCSLDIICATSMGTDVNAQNNADTEYVRSVKEMCRIIIHRTTSILKMYNFFYYLSRDYQKEKKALKIIHDYTYSVIESRKKNLQENSNDINDTDEFGKKQKKTFLDLLLQYKRDGESISEADIREEVDTFMFEGHDTTASAMSSIIYCVASNQEVQEKIVEELNDIFDNDKEKAPTYRDLQDMKYLEAVIKEAMRLYPPVPIFGRHLQENITFDDKVIPAGTTLGVFSYGIHRDPTYFPNPEKFDPERFLSDNQKKLPYAYIPFSAGHRNCIGQKFAVLEMKSVVSRILRTYKILPVSPPHKLMLVAEIVLKSKNGIRVQIEKRI